MPTLTQSSRGIFLPQYKTIAKNQSPSVIKVLDVETVTTIPEKTGTPLKFRKAIIIGCASILIIITAIVAFLLLKKNSSSSSTTTCQNGGALLSNGSCACNNYTTGTYCQTPLCLVAGFFSTTCLNGGTCTYSTSTSTSICSCVSSLWTGGGFNNTFYGHENDVLNASCATGQSLTVAACFYGINSATPGCGGSTVSANCFSMDVTSTCVALCNPNYCYYTIDNANFGDTCFGLVKTFWMYFTCS
ncbi:unnamed protein product [Rotaria socialis]|uniref:EGF-like domain-containing protein n=1 Tax=Rotaria socialis TaxID=392032 RepID=A0A821KB48_9BILA|nr:unnamed protein product [Rotaria socialis]